MKKQQFILVGGGILFFCLIYFFARTLPPKRNKQSADGPPQSSAFDIHSTLNSYKNNLTPSQQSYISQLESSVVRGDTKSQRVRIFHQLAEFWKDSVHLLLPYAYYTAQAAQLENSEKSLTFAAHYFLDNVRGQEDPGLRTWMAIEAKQLFEKALRIAPDNDSLKIGLGSCYLFGNISESPMQGIQMIREVAERDSLNMYAQFMLGYGALTSGQLDKAIERLLTVVRHEPENLEAVIMLAEAYEQKDDRANAIIWYESARSSIKNPQIIGELDKRINSLKK